MAARKAVAVNVAGQLAVAVGKEMAEDGQMERASHPAEGAATPPLALALALALATNRSGAGLASQFRQEERAASCACVLPHDVKTAAGSGRIVWGWTMNENPLPQICPKFLSSQDIKS